MVACGGPECSQKYSGFQIFPAEYLGQKAQKELRRDIQSCAKNGRLCLVKAGEASFNRTLLTTPGVFALSETHLAPKNAFDRVCALQAADRGIAIEIRITPLLELRGVARERVIRLNEEILLLQNRYEFPLIISSGAKHPHELRSPRAIEALLTETGMERDLIRTALSGIPGITRSSSNLGDI